jgi:hypothetical protein
LTVSVAGGKSPHLLDQRPVNRLQLECEGPLGRVVEPVPEGQQMLLTSARKSGDKIR